MKRIISFAMAAIFAFAALWCLPVAKAAETGIYTSKDGKYSYRLINRGKACEIVKLNEKIFNKEENYTVPEEIDGITVTAIGNCAFSIPDDYDYYEKLLNVNNLIIPDTVTYIGEHAFESCWFKTLTLPESVVCIDDYAFRSCDFLKPIQLVIPESVRLLGTGAFSYFHNLKSVIIGSGVKSVSDKCFEYCSKLTSVSFGENVASIGDYAFFHCKELSELHVNADTACGKYFYGYQQDFNWDDEDAYPDECPILDKPENYKLIIDQSPKKYSVMYDGAMKYAYETGVRAIFNLDSSRKTSGICFDCGSTFGLTVDGKKLTGWKSSKPKQIRVSNKGNAVVLCGGSVLSVKLPGGGTYKAEFDCYQRPELLRAFLKGGSKPTVEQEYVDSVTLKKGKTVDLIISGRVPSIANTYTSKKVAKIIASPKSDLIRIVAVKKGKATLGVTVNGYKIKLKVTVK